MISAHDLTLTVGSRLLLDKLNWQAAPGESWCVIGRNGAGKSTLLRTLAGLCPPSAGQVALDGRALPAWSLPALARRRAFLAQSRSDAFGYRVIDTVLAARHPYGATRYWEDDVDHRHCRAALQAMDVDDLAERDIRTLSGGERQRVAIAAMLAQDTPLILLDEPANALDLGHQVGVMRLLAQLCREQAKTVVMIGHDVNLAQRAASHALLLMGDGRWCAGSLADVLHAPLLSQYLGHPIEAIRHQGRQIFIPGEAGP